MYYGPSLLLQAIQCGYAPALPHTLLLALIRNRVRSGQKLFPSVYGTTFNNPLKAVMAKLEIPSAEMYSSHAFRRGASNGLKTRGSQWPTIATLGEWRSPAFRGYLGRTNELNRDMTKLLAETDPISSEDEIEVSTLGAGPQS